jgi:CubicO group peptidase (beta-lactamase class C family)
VPHASRFAAFAALSLVTLGAVPLPPEDNGLSETRLAAIDGIMRRAVASGGFAGASVAVGRVGSAPWTRGYGRLDWLHASPVVDPSQTLYDLASLTKVVATATAVMLLIDDGRLHLDDPVSHHLPDFRGGGREKVTVRMLLEHRSGLPAGRDLYRQARNPGRARRLVMETALVAAPGSREIYSDLGADLLGFVVEAASHEHLDSFLARRVWRPLGMRHTMFRPPRAMRTFAAPTELAPPRGYPLQGEVHDENAYALGGIAGHAGLFSTASDLAIFAQMMLQGGTYRGVRIVRDSTIRLFTSRSAGWRALGWETCPGGGSCGQHMSERAYGHTGFTGTSMWIDPDRALYVIVLTNWVHGECARPATTFGILSDARADVADVATLAVVDGPDGAPPLPAAWRADRAVDWAPPHCN